MRKLALLLAAGLLLGGCAAARRGGKDAVVVATWPVHVVTHPAGRIATVEEKSPVAAWVFWPVLLPWFAFEDSFFTAVAAGDLLLSPFYIPFPVEPLRIYDTRRMPPRLEERSVEGFEQVCAGTAGLAAWFALVWISVRRDIPLGSSSWPGDPPAYR